MRFQTRFLTLVIENRTRNKTKSARYVRQSGIIATHSDVYLVQWVV